MIKSNYFKKIHKKKKKKYLKLKPDHGRGSVEHFIEKILYFIIYK
jgi:hypothetical protein